jgi:hypothetical protein
MDPIQCPQCKTENASTAVFCRKCGADIRPSKPINRLFSEEKPGKAKSNSIRILWIVLAAILGVGLLMGSCLAMKNAGLLEGPTPTLSPTPKPSTPLNAYTFSKWEIWGASSGVFEAHGEIEYYQSEFMGFAPGATITNRTREKIALDVPDYNGDVCRIPYGMTVTVDEYGQFQPYWYYPEMTPPGE